MISATALFLFFPSLCIGAIGSIFLKKAAKNFKLNLLYFLKNNNLIVGVFLSAVSLLLYVISLKYADISKLYPLVSLNYIFIVLSSAIFLKEKITLQKGIGIIFITLGCFLVIG